MVPKRVNNIVIQCDRLPPDNKLVFSDDSALLPYDMRRHIQEWLSEWNPKPWLVLREPIKYNPDINWSQPECLSQMTLKQRYFTREYWRADNRVFRAAMDKESKHEILGPEIDRYKGYVIAPSPVLEVIVKAAEAPGRSIQEKAKLAAEVWATLSDDERLIYPRIGHVAKMADLDSLVW